MNIVKQFAFAAILVSSALATGCGTEVESDNEPTIADEAAPAAENVEQQEQAVEQRTCTYKKLSRWRQNGVYWCYFQIDCVGYNRQWTNMPCNATP